MEQARSLLLQHCPAPETQWVSVGQSYGRVLAETQCAPEPVPPFDRSPLDGYALRASDVQRQAGRHPVTLCITEEVPAGHCAVGRVEPGTAIKILTGAPIPEGADVVVKFEDTAFTDETVTLFRPERSGSNLVRAGEDLAQGAVVAEAGTRLTPPVAGLLGGGGLRPGAGVLPAARGASEHRRRAAGGGRAACEGKDPQQQSLCHRGLSAAPGSADRAGADCAGRRPTDCAGCCTCRGGLRSSS